ncbi:MAG: thioesterase II family protein [Clostridium sp.]
MKIKKKQLFCLPYAGGSATIYYKFSKYLNDNIEVVPVELAGRGMRADESGYNDFEDIVEDVSNIILNEWNGNEFSIIGYSMGSLIAYEVYYKLLKKRNIIPKNMFMCAATSPNVEDRRKIPTDTSDEEFCRRVTELGGMSPEILEDKELLKIFLPIIRNDIKVYNKYVFKEREEKIKSNVFVLYSDEENDYDRIWEWRNYCVNNCNFTRFQGGHFFINKYLKDIIEIINNNI